MFKYADDFKKTKITSRPQTIISFQDLKLYLCIYSIRRKCAHAAFLIDDVLVCCRFEGHIECPPGMSHPSFSINHGILEAVRPRLKDFHQLLLEPPKVRRNGSYSLAFVLVYIYIFFFFFHKPRLSVPLTLEMKSKIVKPGLKETPEAKTPPPGVTSSI